MKVKITLSREDILSNRRYRKASGLEKDFYERNLHAIEERINEYFEYNGIDDFSSILYDELEIMSTEDAI